MLYLVGCYGLHKIRVISMEQMQQKIFDKLFLGISQSKMLDLANDFVNQQFDSMLYNPAVQCLKKARKEGHYTIILSSSPQFLVELFAKRFSVDAWEGTRYELDDAQRFSSISHLMQGKDKADHLNKLFDLLGLTKQQSTAYTDSILDLPMLEMAGIAVGVNPDNKLRTICTIRQWQILDEEK